MGKQSTRKLEDTSWLAQVIKDKMDAESEKMGLWVSSRWNALNTLHIVVNEADDQTNDNIYYDTYNRKRSITICEIPSLTIKHGYDYDTEGMQCRLRGLAERYKDDDGMYIVSVLTTNDLNSATIKDLEELMFQIGTH
ncbi:MAG: hypothetical protein WC810_23550 [Janthinobacterium sp.]|jgi:hypothetical protein